MKRIRYTLALATLYVVGGATTVLSQTATQPLGSGTVGDPYRVASLDNLYWITQNDTAAHATYVQTVDIDASSTSGWDGGQGFLPIGGGTQYFTGTYDGRGHTITGLFINRPSIPKIGMFAILNNAYVNNVRLLGANITGSSWTGALVGYSDSHSVVDSSSSSGTVTGGGQYTAGLIGYCIDTSSVYYSSSTASVTGGSSGYSGGLVGSMDQRSTVTASYSTGDVNNGSAAVTGGLVGSTSTSSIITSSYATGNVSGNGKTGGLVGVNTSSTVNNCYSTGTVTGSGGGTDAGGLIGDNEGGTVTGCYSTSSVSASSSQNIGGLVGENNSFSSLANCYATGTATGSVFVGGLAGENDGTSSISNCYAIGLPSGAGASGLVCNNSGTISISFWNTDIISSGVVLGSAGTSVGATTAQMKTLSTFTGIGWDFVLESINGTNDYWDMDTTNHAINAGYPFLSWQNGPANALPVEMSNLVVAAQKSGVELRWNTSTEVDNEGWQVERNTIADFGLPIADWVEAGFVKGAGTSAQPRQYSFVDQNLPPGLYSYRLKQIDRNGAFKYSQIMQANISSAPKVFTLGQNYPNPFNPTTTIRFTLQKDGLTTLKIYNVLGQEVATLVNEELKTGEYHQATFNASQLSSGIYFAQLRNGNQVQLKKLLLLK